MYEFDKPTFRPKLWHVALGLVLWILLGATIIWWISR
jgi:hypothetical protein